MLSRLFRKTKRRSGSSKTRTRKDKRGDYPQDIIQGPVKPTMAMLKLKDSGELRKEKRVKQEVEDEERRRDEIAEMEPMLKGGKRRRKKTRRNK
jgi:hypothetical protein